MAYINLLPWREEARERQKKVFLTVLLTIALFTLGLTFLVGQFYQLQIDGQNTRNQYLKNEIALLDIKIAEIRELNKTKKDLKKRIVAVEQLQRNRNVGTQVFSEITNIVPSGIYLTSAVKNEDLLSFVGKSESNNNLSNMIRNIEDSTLLYNVKLNNITKKNNRNALLSDFTMTVNVKSIMEEDLDTLTAQEGR